MVDLLSFCETIQTHTKHQRSTIFGVANSPSPDSFPTISAIHMTHPIRPTPSSVIPPPQTSTPPRCLLQYPTNLTHNVDYIPSPNARLRHRRPRPHKTTHPPHTHPHQHHAEQLRIESTIGRCAERDTMGGSNAREPEVPAILQVREPPAHRRI
jgi:hypothetical protein